VGQDGILRAGCFTGAFVGLRRFFNGARVRSSR
jgi:hypothetical protein